MLKYEALGANFSSWEFDSAVASWGDGEIGEGRVLTQLKSNPVFSLAKLENMFDIIDLLLSMKSDFRESFII